MFIFAPTKVQLDNAEQTRTKSDRDLRTLPYRDLLNAQAKDPSVAVISKEESETLPFIPELRGRFFATLPSDMKQFVLRANIAGINVTATGDNGETFLYMAPETELERTRLITELNQLEATTNTTHVIGSQITNESSTEQDIPPMHMSRQM